MKLAKFLRFLGLLATLDFTAATPIEGNKQIEALNNAGFLKNVAKWNAGKNLASVVIDLINRVSQDDYDFLGKLTKDDFTQLVERYFGRGSYPAVKSAVFPMFARMQEGLKLGDQGPLKYRYDQGNKGFSGSAYTFEEVISFANQGLIHHPFVDKIDERARVWIHEMAHLNWVNGGNGVHDIPTDSIQFSTDALQKSAKPLASVYGETLTQYLALCYPNQAPFSNDNVARFAMAVFHTARKGHKPKPAKLKHQCPSSPQEGHLPTFGLRNIPTLAPEIDDRVLPKTRWIDDVGAAEPTSTPTSTLY